MNTDKIDALLEKFYDGSATDDEERMLAAYFRSEKNIPRRYAADRDIVLGLNSGLNDADIPLPKGLGSRLNDMIDGLADEEKTKDTAGNIFHKINWKAAASIAACAAIALGTFFTFINLDGSKVSGIEPEITAQDSEKSSIDIIKHNVETTATTASTETQYSADSTAKKAAAATAKIKPHKRRSNRTRRVISNVDEATAQQRIDNIKEPASPDEAVLIAEAAFQKLAMRLEHSAIQLDIAESKIDMIPETIELSKY